MSASCGYDHTPATSCHRQIRTSARVRPSRVKHQLRQIRQASPASRHAQLSLVSDIYWPVDIVQHQAARPVRQGRRAQWSATALAAFLSAGVLLGDSSKEDLLAILAGSAVLVAAAWSPPRRWPALRFAATTAAGTCLAFAGIVGLEAPDATSAWLVGAGLSGSARYWIDSLIRTTAQAEGANIAALLEKIDRQTASGSSRPSAQESGHRSGIPGQTGIVVALITGLVLGAFVKGRRQQK